MTLSRIILLLGISYVSYHVTQAVDHEDAISSGLLWSRDECLQRFPGLASPPVFAPLPTPYDILDTNIPVFIISFNNPTFLRNMFRQVDCYSATAVVIDTGSTFAPSLVLLQQINTTIGRNQLKHQVFTAEPWNSKVHLMPGHWFTSLPPEHHYSNTSHLHRFAALTDADLEFNPLLPPNFLNFFANLSILSGRKVGFALNISNPERFWDNIISKWEPKYYQHRYSVPGIQIDMYSAMIDSTMAVYDLSNVDCLRVPKACHPKETLAAVRVAGPFTAEHTPWKRNFFQSWHPDEVLLSYGPEAKGSSIARTYNLYARYEVPKNDTLVYIVHHDQTSRDIADAFYTLHPTWTASVHINSTWFFESIFFKEILPQRRDEWRDRKYVGMMQYRCVDAMPDYVESIIALSLGKKTHDVITFSGGDNADLAYEPSFKHGISFIIAWNALLGTMGFSEDEIKRYTRGKTFYRNSFVCTNALMVKYMDFFGRAYDVAMHNSSVHALMTVRAKYRGVNLEVARRIFGASYYNLFPFIFERLPIFFFRYQGASILYNSKRLSH